nr:MAG TPA: Head decoration protein [Caudoviricetes sp.]
MSFVTNTTCTKRPNFLESEVGLVLKTREITASMGVQDGIYKIVAPGTPYPSNDANAVGIVFETVDVTSGNMPGSVLVAGRVLAENLNLATAAKTALAGKGIVFVDTPAIVRGYTVTYDKNDGSGTPPVDGNSYFEGSVAQVSTSYPLTKSGSTQTGWSTSKGGAAVTEVEITGDVTLYPVWTTNG